MSAFADHNTRNWLAVAAHNRRGGPMRDRRASRGGAQVSATRDALSAPCQGCGRIVCGATCPEPDAGCGTVCDAPWGCQWCNPDPE